MSREFRSGFACLVGRPNAGKSTLVNAMVGRKIAITSEKAQTTRRVVRGVVTGDDAQVVIVDTPGVHKPRTLLGERLNDLAQSMWSEVDVIVSCLAADEKTGPGDRRLLAEVASSSRRPIVVVVTKTDAATPDQIAARLASAAEEAQSLAANVVDYVPVSAVTGANLETLFSVLTKWMPPGPKLFPDDVITDEPTEAFIAELIREAALDGVQQELPHSIAVTIDEMITRDRGPDKGDILEIYATIHVERDSQKPIIIGKKGQRLKTIGSRSRPDIEKLVGMPVFLSVHVRVAKEWQRDPKQLRRLGF